MLSRLFLTIALAIASLLSYAQDAPVEQDHRPAKNRKRPRISKDKDVPVKVDPPAFPGGLDSLASFLKRTIVYPDSCMAHDAEGIVYMSFVVNKDGRISDIEKVKNDTGCEDFEAEAMRVLQMMPAWTPGRQQGKPVNMKLVQPIKFSLK